MNPIIIAALVSAFGAMVVALLESLLRYCVPGQSKVWLDFYILGVFIMNKKVKSRNKYPIKRSSMSETVLNFLYIFSKTKVYGDPTREQIYGFAPTKFKKRDNLDRCMDRLVDFKLISSYTRRRVTKYKITPAGIRIIYGFAVDRGLTNKSISENS